MLEYSNTWKRHLKGWVFRIIITVSTQTQLEDLIVKVLRLWIRDISQCTILLYTWIETRARVCEFKGQSFSSSKSCSPRGSKLIFTTHYLHVRWIRSKGSPPPGGGEGGGEKIRRRSGVQSNTMVRLEFGLWTVKKRDFTCSYRLHDAEPFCPGGYRYSARGTRFACPPPFIT